MAKLRRVAVMIELDRPVVHHYQVFEGIERYARECGHWQCILNPHPQLDLKGRRKGMRIDGIVGRIWQDTARCALKARVPMVNTMIHGRDLGVPSVLHDPQEAGRMAAQHLLARGLRNFAFVGFPDANSSLELDAMREVIRAAGYACSSCRVSRYYARTDASWARFRGQLDEWMSRWSTPIGVFGAHDMLCRHVATACIMHGLEVPFDVALIGSANEPVVCRPEPTLTSIDFGFERIGYHAAELLDQLMDGAPPPAGPIYLLPTELIPRRSTDVVAVDNPTVARAMRYIMERSHKPISVDGVARHVGSTPWTLLRLFHRYLGHTVEHFIIMLRHERLRRLLVESDEPLKVLAKESGFRDAIELSKSFHRMEGIAPSEYRKLRAGRRT